MVIAGAGVSRAGQREVALINSTDLFATFASLTKINTKVPKNSFSFAAALTSNSFEGRSHAYMDFRENGRVKTAIRDSRYKLIEQEGGQRQLFDLRTDPYETQDLLATDSQGNTSSSALQHIVTSLIHQRNIFQK
jgi:arylsulfatase B